MSPSAPTPWHATSATDCSNALQVALPAGLTEIEAHRRQVQHGPNTLPAQQRRNLLAIALAQFSDFMILMLIAAAIISGLIGEAQDTLTIIIIVALNAGIGFIQDYRAERALAALRTLAAPRARVRRDSHVLDIPAEQLVAGDVILLEAGDMVPADARLFITESLQTDESALTGESQPIDKDASARLSTDATLGDRRNMAYKGTLVTRGRSQALVVATGPHTEIGKIAALLEGKDTVRTPLQIRLAQFGKRLSVIVLMLCAVVFVTGLLRGEPLLLMFLTAVSLAVAAIPEALPAVVTISLALGARTMARYNALVRNLPAVESLGSVTYICADKTGTLTENRLEMEVVVTAEGRFPSTAYLVTPAGTQLAEALALSNDVDINATGSLFGDPTERALYLAAQTAGFRKVDLQARHPRLAEIPFDAERKRMTTVHRVDSLLHVYTKGAPETLLPHCTRLINGDVPDVIALEQEAETLAAEGYRVLAVAYKAQSGSTLPSLDTLETDLIFLGLVGLIDSPREEAAHAVMLCKRAGIVPVMITGDHPATARAIAVRIGLVDADDHRVLTGSEMARLSPQELAAQVQHIRVYARVAPAQKIAIVAALQARGEFVAMTGDGVNDAPALKKAHIGVAMGRHGTDVAREAADMVLLDDNFATMVTAVEHGRRIFDNIRKFIRYGVTTNTGELLTLLLAPFFGLPIPLLPIHILWINLVTDGLPGLALTMEPAERGVMQRPPRPPDESIFAHGMWQHMVWVGSLIAALTLATQSWAIGHALPHWQTMVFTTLTFCQLTHVMAIRTEREALFSTGVAGNPALLGAVALTVALQLLVIYWPPLQGIFNTQALTPGELLACLSLAMVVFVSVEIEKYTRRKRPLAA